MTIDDIKKDLERRTFVKFCEVARLSILQDSLVQPDPPAPDIEVELAEIGRVAFELVSLNHKIERQAAVMLGASASGLDAYYARLPAAELAAFSELFRNALITVFFKRELGNSDRKKTYQWLFQTLRNLPPDFSGSVLDYPHCVDVSSIRETFGKHKALIDSMPEIEGIYITRGANILGPRFGTPSTGKTLQLDLGKLEEKLRKAPYQTGMPQELLATIHGPSGISYAADAASIPQIIGNLIARSCFRRVWIFEAIMGKTTAHERSA